GGVEVAFALAARLGGPRGERVAVTLLEAGPRVLPGYALSAARRVESAAAARRIVVRCDATVARVEADTLSLVSGERIAA
ncbi:hypothetical protein RSW44_25290, partial [Escherichia coli]